MPNPTLDELREAVRESEEADRLGTYLPRKYSTVLARAGKAQAGEKTRAMFCDREGECGFPSNLSHQGVTPGSNVAPHYIKWHGKKCPGTLTELIPRYRGDAGLEDSE